MLAHRHPGPCRIVSQKRIVDRAVLGGRHRQRAWRAVADPAAGELEPQGRGDDPIEDPVVHRPADRYVEVEVEPHIVFRCTLVFRRAFVRRHPVEELGQPAEPRLPDAVGRGGRDRGLEHRPGRVPFVQQPRHLLRRQAVEQEGAEIVPRLPRPLAGPGRSRRRRARPGSSAPHAPRPATRRTRQRRPARTGRSRHPGARRRSCARARPPPVSGSLQLDFHVSSCHHILIGQVDKHKSAGGAQGPQRAFEDVGRSRCLDRHRRKAAGLAGPSSGDPRNRRRPREGSWRGRRGHGPRGGQWPARERHGLPNGNHQKGGSERCQRNCRGAVSWGARLPWRQPQRPPPTLPGRPARKSVRC